jgi:hypothetical protein
MFGGGDDPSLVGRNCGLLPPGHLRIQRCSTHMSEPTRCVQDKPGRLGLRLKPHRWTVAFLFCVALLPQLVIDNGEVLEENGTLVLLLPFFSPGLGMGKATPGACEGTALRPSRRAELSICTCRSHQNRNEARRPPRVPVEALTCPEHVRRLPSFADSCMSC